MPSLSMPKGISLPSPGTLKSALKKLMEVELLGSGDAASDTKGGGSSHGSPAKARRASQEESELCDLSWRRLGGANKYPDRPEGGYVQEGDFAADGRPRRRNEVAERLQEIAERMIQEEHDRLHADERRRQLHSELAGAAKRRGAQGSVPCACTGLCDCPQGDHDNASTTLSLGETEEGLEASHSRDWEREQRHLVVMHTVKSGDTAASICVQYDVALGQILQANRAFSAHSLLLRKEIKIPMMTQMDPY